MPSILDVIWSDQIKCPWCGKVCGQHVDYDYATEFELECQWCGGTADIEVVAIPEFGATKKKDPSVPRPEPVEQDLEAALRASLRKTA